jgi:hypothetical protein
VLSGLDRRGWAELTGSVESSDESLEVKASIRVARQMRENALTPMTAFGMNNASVIPFGNKPVEPV